MDKKARDAQLRRLTAAARVGGRNAGLRPRTHYLTPQELRGVPASRLIRETAWAERSSASQQWRDDRRDVVADEFERRGYSETSAQVRAAWSHSDYTDARAGEAERRAYEAENRQQAQQEQSRDYAAGTGPGFTEAATVAAAATTMAAIGESIDPENAEPALAGAENSLDQAWSSTATAEEPEMAGAPDMTEGSVSADMVDSLSVATPSAPTAQPAQPEAQPEATPEI